MIRVGVSGVPRKCESNDIVSALEYIKKIGLNAMEITGENGVLQSHNGMNPTAIEKVKNMLMEDMVLSIHVPCRTNLAGNRRVIDSSIEMIKHVAEIGQQLSARIIVFHPGFYNYNRETTQEKMITSITNIHNDLNTSGINTPLGLETASSEKEFGSLDDIIYICSKVEGALPVLDFAHIHARTKSSLTSQEEFSKIFDTVEKTLNKVNYHIHVSGLKYRLGQDCHAPIDSKNPDYQLLADEIISRKIDATIICESPKKEDDAIKIRDMLCQQKNI